MGLQALFRLASGMTALLLHKFPVGQHFFPQRIPRAI